MVAKCVILSYHSGHIMLKFVHRFYANFGGSNFSCLVCVDTIFFQHHKNKSTIIHYLGAYDAAMYCALRWWTIHSS